MFIFSVIVTATRNRLPQRECCCAICQSGAQRRGMREECWWRRDGHSERLKMKSERRHENEANDLQKTSIGGGKWGVVVQGSEKRSQILARDLPFRPLPAAGAFWGCFFTRLERNAVRKKYQNKPEQTEKTAFLRQNRGLRCVVSCKTKPTMQRTGRATFSVSREFRLRGAQRCNGSSSDFVLWDVLCALSAVAANPK